VARPNTRDWFAEGARVGDYKIDRPLGSEETGMVYLATHVVLPRKAAIKVMHADQAWLRQIAVQMLREACILEALNHPGIPRVYECGVLADRRPWTAFEWVEGATLGEVIGHAPLAIADLVVALRDVADVLTHAHDRGVVHRRLTADAIARTPGRRLSVVVRQWGDACTLDTEARISVDARDDVHALGVIAFRALTGTVPTSLVSASDRCPMAPRDLTALIDHMLATDPNSRPTSAEVRDRASWLATTHETAPPAPRWTPPLGMSDSVPAGADDASSGFSIRISRTRTP
jgi:serine/threonine protein kinase